MAVKRVPSLIAVLVAIAALGAILTAPASAALRHIDGTVVSKNAQDRSFRISTQSGTVRVRVNAATVFERISGFGALHKGLEIEVDAKQTSSGLLAKQVETRGGSGGGDHGGGSDDGPNHT